MLREKSPARSPQDARPPPAGPESELAAQDRAAAESAQETATQESGSGSIEDDGGALARALDAIGQPQLDSSGLEDGAVPAAFLAALERQQIAVKIAGADVKVATADALDAADAPPPPEQHSGEAGSSSADSAEDLSDFVVLDADSTAAPAGPLQSEPNLDQAEPPVGTPSSVASNALGLLSQYLGSRALAQRLSRLLHAGIVDVLRTHVTDHDSGLARFLSEQSAARAGGLDRAQFGAVVSYQGQDAARVDVHCRLLGPLPASQPAGAAESAGLGPPSLDLKVSFLIPQQGPIAVISPLLYEYHAA
jgi:hypothetical protein